jgi:hypothetical protein
MYSMRTERRREAKRGIPYAETVGGQSGLIRKLLIGDASLRGRLVDSGVVGGRVGFVV